MTSRVTKDATEHVTHHAPRPLSPIARIARSIECLVLFFALPLAFVVGPPEWIRFLFPALWLGALFCLLLLLGDPTFDRRSLWRWKGIKADGPRILLQCLAIFPLITLLVLAYDRGWLPMPGNTPEGESLLFRLPREAPTLWLFIMLLYPLFSVYAQELVFRTFFFHRYGGLIAHTPTLVTINALAFAVAHLPFGNAIAAPLSALGSILFAITYLRTRSTAAVCLEHALIGNIVFTTGLGWFFYTGSAAGG